MTFSVGRIDGDRLGGEEKVREKNSRGRVNGEMERIEGLGIEEGRIG